MKTTLEMPDALFRKAKAEAAMRGKTLKQLVIEALERDLNHGRPVTSEGSQSILRQVKAVARANGDAWQSGRDAVSAVREQRY